VDIFIAGAVGIEERPDVNSVVVVLAEHADGSGARLELQRALSFDEQDRKLGMDTYCLCVTSGATHYGGVTSWSLRQGRLELALTDDAAATLGTSPSIVVSLHVDVSLDPLRVALDRILTARFPLTS
jgi:hypothetical protein